MYVFMETKKRALQGRREAGFLGHIVKNKAVSMEVKHGLCDGIFLPTVTNANDNHKCKREMGME